MSHMSNKEMTKQENKQYIKIPWHGLQIQGHGQWVHLFDRLTPLQVANASRIQVLPGA